MLNIVLLILIFLLIFYIIGVKNRGVEKVEEVVGYRQIRDDDGWDVLNSRLRSV